jgi:hypothetical protein
MSEFRRAYDLLRGYIHHEWERIQTVDWNKAWDELKSPSEPELAEDEQVEKITIDPKKAAALILGVKEDCPFEDVKKAFDRLNTRSDPKRFPEGSVEAENAAKINARINWAYRTLTEGHAPAERRFKNLEVD